MFCSYIIGFKKYKHKILLVYPYASTVKSGDLACRMDLHILKFLISGPLLVCSHSFVVNIFATKLPFILTPKMYFSINHLFDI